MGQEQLTLLHVVHLPPLEDKPPLRLIARDVYEVYEQSNYI